MIFTGVTTFDELFKQHPRKIPVIDPKNLVTRAEMLDELDSVLELETVSEVNKFQSVWAARMQASKSLQQTLKKGESCVTGHIKRAKSTVAAATKRDQAKSEKAQITKVRQMAQKAADRINNPAAASRQNQQIVKISFGEFSSVKTQDSVVGRVTVGDDPMIITNWDMLAAWFSKTGQDMTDYAQQYSKTVDYREQGRTQSPVTEPTTKNANDKLFQSLDVGSPVDISSVSGGSTFMRRTWYWGYAMTVCEGSLLPQAAAMARMVVAGTLTCYMISCQDLLKVTEPGISLDALSAAVAGLTLAQLNQWQAKGANVYHAEVTPSSAAPSMLYIPQGWFVYEVANAKEGEPLLYGVRKSIFTSSEAARRNFAFAGKMIEASGNGVEKHNAVMELLGKVECLKA